MDQRKLALKLLLVVSGFPSTNNPSRSSFNLTAAKLLSTKHEVSILQIRAWKPKRKLLDFGTFKSFKIILISFPLFNFRFLNSILLNHFFLQFVLNLYKKKIPKVDIIHSVGGGLTSYASYIISKKLKIPFIIQYIGSDVNFYLSKNKVKQEIRNYINSSSYHIFNSEELKTVFTGFFPNISNKKVVYRGIKLGKRQDFNPHIFKAPVLLYLGGLTSGDYGKYKNNLKGGVTLLKAWEKLDSNQNLSNVELLFGGPNSNKYVDYLDFSNLNYPKSFKVIGELSKFDVIKYLKKSNIVIIPSLFEGTPNVAFEAMATNNMIIGTTVGGIPEIIDKKCGILIEPNDDNEIVKAIQYTINYPEIIKIKANNGLEKIKKYDNKFFLEGYTDIYNKILK